MKRKISVYNKLILPAILFTGIIGGISVYILYMSRAHSYLSDDPAACINCHIMTPYYDSWKHSSHAKWASCNDCHVPQDNVIKKYAFKAKDGLYHASVFTVKGEPQVIRPKDASYTVIMNNCIRCHTQLNTELVNTGKVDYMDTKEGKGKACWDCHSEVPHTKEINISSTPNSLAPLPSSPVPAWLKDKIKKQ